MRAVLIIIGSVLIGDSLLVSTVSNINAGTVLPAILGLPLLFIGIFYGKAQLFFASGGGAIIKWTLIAGYAAYILLLAVTVPLMCREGYKTPEPDADALIVLGCGVRGERVSLTLARRLDRAIEYAEENPETLLILSGGQGRGEDITEAEAMRRYLVARGIDGSRLRLETESDSTYTNFTNSMAIITGELGEDATVVFVTTRFHVLRAEDVARGLGINAEGIGASGVAYIEPNNYMRESLVIVYYLLTGRM